MFEHRNIAIVFTAATRVLNCFENGLMTWGHWQTTRVSESEALCPIWLSTINKATVSSSLVHVYTNFYFIFLSFWDWGLIWFEMVRWGRRIRKLCVLRSVTDNRSLRKLYELFWTTFLDVKFFFFLLFGRFVGKMKLSCDLRVVHFNNVI